MDDHERIDIGMDQAREVINEANGGSVWEGQDRDVLLATLVLQMAQLGSSRD